MTIEYLEEYFKATAMEKGFITSGQLKEPQKIQVTENLRGKQRRLISQILFDLGFMTFPQIDEVLKSMPFPTDEQEARS